MKQRALHHFVASLALLMGAGSCMDFNGVDKGINITTHVDDWRDEVIYQILVDRFANGDEGNDYRIDANAPARYHGGDWQGIVDNLDYLETLGVTALWISPVVKNVETDADVDGYHGYWAQDFEATNPHFGDMAALRGLVDAAHARGMKVIIDIVANHVGQAFYYDINMNGSADVLIQGNGIDSPVVHINEYDPDFDARGIQAFTSLGEAGPAPVIFGNDPATNHMPPNPAPFRKVENYNRKGRTIDFEDEDQLLHGDFPGGLKDLDTRRCEVKQTFVDVYARWIELSDADGFRIDTIKHVEYEFWRYFAPHIRRRLAAKGKTNFFMFGEAFDGRDDLVGSFTKTFAPDPSEEACETDGQPITGEQVDGVFYFPQYFQAIRDVFQYAQSTDRIEQLWADRSANYGTQAVPGGIGIPPTEAVVNFLDNHDVARFLYGVQDQPAPVQRALMHNALAFVFAAQGIPCLYYGTEQDFAGGNDPANREDLWTSGYATDGDTFQWIQRLIKIRNSYTALRRGDLSVVWSTSRTGDEEDAGVFAFQRNGGDQANGYVLVVFNTHRSKESHTGFEGNTMSVVAPPGTVLVDVLGPAQQSFTVSADGRIDVTVAASSAMILVPQGDVTSLD